MFVKYEITCVTFLSIEHLRFVDYRKEDAVWS